MKEQNREITEIERMAIDIDKLFYEAEIKQTLPKKHPSIAKAEALYNAGYRKQEWISVEDRLPTWKDGKVLIYTTHGISIAQRTTSERWQGDLAKPKWITHWMPLPEPPKMKGGEADA